MCSCAMSRTGACCSLSLGCCGVKTTCFNTPCARFADGAVPLPSSVSIYRHRSRPFCGASLLLVATQLSPHGLQPRALVYQLLGLLATALRRRLALAACYRTAQPSRLWTCVQLTLFDTPATAPRRRPGFHCRKAQPSRAAAVCSSCYVARMRPHRGVCLPIDTAQLIPRGSQPDALRLTIWLACDRIARR